MELELLLSLHSQQQLFVNPRRIRLLEKIREHGSISQGAKAAGISYKSAWDAIKAMNTLAKQPVLSSETGGKGGGGAVLTAYGERLLKIYGLLTQIERMAVDALQDERTSLDSLLSVVARFSLQTSARNQFFAKVSALDLSSLSRKVCLTLPGDTTLYADITASSCQRLKLAPGKEVLALVKAPWVTLSTDATHVPKGDNVLIGTVSEVIVGEGFDEVLLQLDSGEPLCALLPHRRHQLSRPSSNQGTLAQPTTVWQLGDKAYAHFSPSHVIIATLG